MSKRFNKNIEICQVRRSSWQDEKQNPEESVYTLILYYATYNLSFLSLPHAKYHIMTYILGLAHIPLLAHFFVYFRECVIITIHIIPKEYYRHTPYYHFMLDATKDYLLFIIILWHSRSFLVKTRKKSITSYVHDICPHSICPHLLFSKLFLLQRNERSLHAFKETCASDKKKQYKHTFPRYHTR